MYAARSFGVLITAGRLCFLFVGFYLFLFVLFSKPNTLIRTIHKQQHDIN